MKRLNVNVKFLDNFREGIGYATDGASGLDLTAGIEEDIVLQPCEFKVIPLGIAFEIPAGYEGQIRGRSGMAASNGIGVVNGVGTIDSDYRGEVSAILINFGMESFTIKPGMRIAQIIFAEVCRAQLTLKPNVGASLRGEAGFGSTGHGFLETNLESST